MPVKPKRFWEEFNERIHAEQRLTMRCAFCRAHASGLLDEMREWLREHQREKHPDFVPRKLSAQERRPKKK